jgi:antitoxin (DNA-binding transcriptional repressor) of toxin-antitoxin stability system
LVDQVQSGIQVILTSHGQPKAVLSAYRPAGKPWRVATPDDSKLSGEWRSPAMETGTPA